ncbi:2Fe-2S iron-sulfur cluster-binding protein [Nesterenkonia populi]|uniref:2Fe-2S iron-sulfur cluster-binding protein n=1 Tax=Nesterenkonia populi TaxID=1591087 RepID=UPI0011BDBA77|nr:2Fe-2S iron-sulfur cluster-binding protein [Nesterenkonia populi]
MPRITYHQPGGSSQTVELETPAPIMQTALRNGVPGIVGECGGQAMCATCHVYVRNEYLDQLPEKSEEEEEMLEEAAAELDEERSRLGCQITIGENLDEIAVDIPERQV